MKIWKSLLIAAFVLVTTTLGAATPASAGALAACGRICDGQDPNDSNCALTGVNKFAPVMGLQLRYSTNCQTTWGLLSGYCSCQVDYIEIRSYFSNGTLRAATNERARSNSAATVMLDDAGLYNQACISYSTDDGATHHVQCTPKY